MTNIILMIVAPIILDVLFSLTKLRLGEVEAMATFTARLPVVVSSLNLL